MSSGRQAWVAALAALIMVSIIWAAVPVMAQSYDPYDEMPRQTGVEKALNKLGRGVSNVMFGWAEIPMTFDRKMKEGKPLQYLLGVVPVIGTARAVMRTSTGALEVVSFPFTDRNVNYEAVLEPEYLF